MNAKNMARQRKIVAQIIRDAGNQVKAAERLACSQSHISKLLRGGKAISPELAIRAEEQFPNLVTRAQLRPDLWG